ncbi:MAG: LysE family translocator [Amphritea sp.]|nr:LysE family translocator [Amphritea sp.]
MVEIFAYAFGIMYSPGPANMLSMNGGIHGSVSPTFRFCIGVGSAMLILFLLFGYTGSLLVTPESQMIISVLGCIYISYLGYQIGYKPRSHPVTKLSNTPEKSPGYRTGLVMQLLNPKAFIAILPIATVQFPAADIDGYKILLWSGVLSVMAFGAPFVYLLMGARLGRFVKQDQYFIWLNRGMALLLFYVAADIAYNHVWIKF